MTDIERLYEAAVDKLSPKERVARSVELFNWSREFIGRQVRIENPSSSVERIKLLVALRMYGSEPGMRNLIKGLLDDVPD